MPTCKSVLVNLVSTRRNSGSNQNPTWLLYRSVQNVSQIKPMNFNTFVSWYNVRTGINDTIYFTNSAATPVVAVLTQQYYDANTLATAIGTVMTSADGVFSYSCSFNAATGKFTITSSVNSYLFTWGTNTRSSARILMGFSAANTAAATSQTSDLIVNLGNNERVNVLIQNFNVESVTQTEINGTLLSVSVNGVFPYSLQWQNNSQLSQIWNLTPNGQIGQAPVSMQNLDAITLALVYEDGTPVVTNEIQWDITLEIDYISL